MTTALKLSLAIITIYCLGFMPAVSAQPWPPTPSPLFNCSHLDPVSYHCCSFFQYLYNITDNGTISKEFNFTTDAAYFIEYSGHNTNDLGFYSSCKNTPARNYLMMELTEGAINVPDGSFGIYTGLCLPDYCQLSYLQSQSTEVSRILQFLNVPYLKDLNVVFIDPNNYTIEQDFYLYFTIALLSILFLLNILGTYLPYLVKPEKKPATKTPLPLDDPLSINEPNNDGDERDEYLLPGQEKKRPQRNSLKHKVAKFLETHPKLLKVLESFDFHKNMKGFFAQEKGANMDQNLNVLDGLRTFAFFGIIYCHTFLNAAVSKNEFSLFQFGKEPGISIVLAAFFGVDVFLILSGFLQGFQLTSKLKKMTFGWKNYLKLVRHRWVRIIPAYFVAILIFWKVAVYFGDGPTWYQFVNRAQQCTDTWWKNVLLLDNALDTGSGYYCFNWGWYLACDFQLFLMAPFICWIYLKNRSRGYNLIWLLFIISCVAGFMGAADVNFKYTIPLSPMTGNFWASFYGNSIVRMSSYLLGILFGIQYRSYKSGETDNMFAYLSKNTRAAYLTSLIGFSLLTFEMFFPLVIQSGTQWTDGFNYLWQVIDRPMLAAGLFLTVVPAIIGLMKPISWFLGSYILLLGSKISFCGYLIQDIVILTVVRGQTNFSGFSFGGKSTLAIAYIMISLFFGTLLHLAVEKPATKLESIFMAPPQAPPMIQEQKPETKIVEERANQKQKSLTEDKNVPSYKITGKRKMDEDNKV